MIRERVDHPQTPVQVGNLSTGQTSGHPASRSHKLGITRPPCRKPHTFTTRAIDSPRRAMALRVSATGQPSINSLS